jgi:hypothetical protein
MKENVGRTRLSRESRAHASARVANPTRFKRGRRRQSPVPFQGRHDHEAGASDDGSSQRRSRASQDQVEAVAPELEDEVQDDAPDAVLPSDGYDDDDVGHEPTDGRYVGGPTLLHSYHKHRANRIWATRNFEDKVYTN